ncbi:MAG: FtsX-like permease family protein [Bacteroidota bacterium]
MVWLVQALSSNRDAEIILGDLHEMYEERCEQKGRALASIGYVTDIITMLANGAFRKDRKRYSPNNPLIMLNNYLKTGVRQLNRQRLHNAINIGGLAIGMMVTFVIGLFINQELSFDKFHEKGDRTYLLTMTWTMGSTPLPVAAATSAAGPFAKEVFPQVESMARIRSESLILTHNGSVIEERKVYWADSTFFDVFTFPLVVGNPKHALFEPMSIVLTEKTAARYFGLNWKDDILSQSIVGQDNKNYRVTGVVKDPPINSHLQFDLLLSMSSIQAEREGNFDNSSYLTYLVLHPASHPEDMVARMPGLLKARGATSISNAPENFGTWLVESMNFDLVPMFDTHLRNQVYIGVPGASDIIYVYVFSAIAMMVLLIAVINYMNLSTARSLERSKEVGVRKTMGAFRIQLFGQFLGESMVVSFIALILATLLTIVALPLFTRVTGKILDVDIIHHPEWLLYVALLWIVVSILGGAYPAIILSSYKPALVLKGSMKNSVAGLSLRRALVITQFAASILLIISTTMIREQLRFMSTADVGFDKEKLLSFQLDSVSRLSVDVLRKEFAATPGVEEVSATMFTPVNVTMRSAFWIDGVKDRQILGMLATDTGFVSTAGLKLIAGDNFSPNVERDSNWEFLVNESAVKFFNWTNETAPGKTLKAWGSQGVVKGVVKDFHFAPLHTAIQPFIISAGRHPRSQFNYLVVRAGTNDYPTLISNLENKWKELTPASIYSFSFVDQRYQDLYETEVRLSDIMDVFSALAILIACLGLFGLASYTIVQRTKEFGIRKVLGATVLKLMLNVSGNLIALIAISFLIALPASWYIAERWLTNFHYHIGFDWWAALLAGAFAILIGAATVAWHSLEAARVNPVKSLRTE